MKYLKRIVFKSESNIQEASIVTRTVGHPTDRHLV
jgi:hypothetical protein